MCKKLLGVIDTAEKNILTAFYTNTVLFIGILLYQYEHVYNR